MKKLILITSIMMMAVAIASAQIINVPGDYPTIQEGINAASNGETVLVDTGTYYENINFRGKAITVASNFINSADTNDINNTIINGSQPTYTDSAAVVTFCNYEDTTSILSGFTITGGSGLLYPDFFAVRAGGGIACWNAGAKILNNKIIDNNANAPAYAGGGGIVCLADGYAPWMVIKNNIVRYDTITSVSSESFGAGIYVLSFAIIENNIIEHNYSYCENGLADGGGIGSESFNPPFDKKIFLSNNTIQNNTVEGYNARGGGIYCNNSSADIYNCIIRSNVVLAQDIGFGCGIGLFAGTEKVNVVGNEISENTLYSDNNSFGGGMMVKPFIASFNILNNTISGNSSTANVAAYSGGVHIFWNESETSVQNNIIHNNSAFGGTQSMSGGILIDKPQSKIIILGNSIVNNDATGGYEYGGGIALYQSLEVEVIFDKNLIAYNYSGFTGGGFYAKDSYNFNLTNNVLVNNEAGNSGGAMRFYTSTDKELTVLGMTPKNKTLSPNPHNKRAFHPLLINNTIAWNTASLGGAFSTNYDENAPIIFNSIFWGNEATILGNDIYSLASLPLHISYNNIDTGAVIGPWDGEENINEDPLFIPGDTISHINGGPCHNTGINELEVGGITYFSPDVDYDGDPRPQGPFWDIGADECLIVGVSQIYTSKGEFLLKITPNPSSGIFNTTYELKIVAEVTLSVMNIRGEVLESYNYGEQGIGEKTARFDLSHLPNGLYLIRVQAGTNSKTSKIIIHK